MNKLLQKRSELDRDRRFTFYDTETSPQNSAFASDCGQSLSQIRSLLWQKTSNSQAAPEADFCILSMARSIIYPEHN